MNDKEKSSLTLHRIQDSYAPIRDLKVIIDGKNVGAIPYSSRKIYHLEQGFHQIYVKMDWCRSKPYEFNLRESESLELYCGSRFFSKRWIFNITASIFLLRALRVKFADPIKAVQAPWRKIA